MIAVIEHIPNRELLVGQRGLAQIIETKCVVGKITAAHGNHPTQPFIRQSVRLRQTGTAQTQNRTGALCLEV